MQRDPMKLRREKILLEHLFRVYENPRNSASSILLDKKFFNLQLNVKSEYKAILNFFLSANNIVLNKPIVIYKTTPRKSRNSIVDLDAFQDMQQINKDQVKINALVTTTITQYKHLYNFTIFVDGSVGDNDKVGYAILCSDLNLKIQSRLADRLTIYFVEAYAILKALKLAGDSGLTSFAIISDSLGVLQDIESLNYTTSPHPSVIYEICQLVSRTEFRHCKLKWLPGIKKHVSLQLVDQMAKSAKYLQCVEQIDSTPREASLFVNDCILR